MSLGDSPLGEVALGGLPDNAATSSGAHRLRNIRLNTKQAPHQSIDWSQPLIERPADPSPFANSENAQTENTPAHIAPLNETDAEIKALMQKRLAALEREAQGLAQVIAKKEASAELSPTPEEAPTYYEELSLILLIEAA